MEKQFPQITVELVSNCSLSIALFEHIMQLPEMAAFDNFENLYFFLGIEYSCYDIDDTLDICFLTERNQ